MVLTVAVVTLAAGAVAELQLRMGYVSPAANGAAVGIGRRGFLLVFRGCVKGNDLRLDRGLLLSEQTGEFDPPASGDDILNIRTEEKQIVGDGNDGEEIVGERQGKQIHNHDRQIKEGEEPCFYRNDKEQQEPGIGIQGGETQKQAQVQIGDAGLPAENHAVKVHHDHAGKVEQVKPQGSPVLLHSSADGIVAVKGNKHQNGLVNLIGDRVGNQTPDLTLQNGGSVKAKQVIQYVVTSHAAHEIDNRGTDHNVQHQVGDTFVFVPVTEQIKLSA